ncbi:GNAT family N-acetyltransferase [Carnobacterium funditum]|uniref:GNAT family N-acetyltransferase n=1 Tax=Carnobacterium funditum TaxID=2752 RepID=UPI00054DBF50|nr:GNAT family N-acetyltransferase [Carnobacterium funditum]
MKLYIGNDIWNKAGAFYVRMSVFVLERQMELSEEFDNLDDSNIDYAVMYDHEKPVSTGRYELPDSETIRIGRIATLKEYRGQKLSRSIIHALEEIGREKGCKKASIHSEQTATSFYEELDYRIVSDEFYENNVPCVLLEKNL